MFLGKREEEGGRGRGREGEGGRGREREGEGGTERDREGEGGTETKIEKVKHISLLSSPSCLVPSLSPGKTMSKL